MYSYSGMGSIERTLRLFFFNQVTGSLWAADGCYDPDIAAMNGGEKI